jgi:hypothetical protein
MHHFAENNIPLTNSYATNKRQIIVLSYARSGSSFTADIVIQDPRTFFTFEPLYKVLLRYTGSDQLQSFDVLSRYMSSACVQLSVAI